MLQLAKLKELDINPRLCKARQESARRHSRKAAPDVYIFCSIKVTWKRGRVHLAGRKRESGEGQVTRGSGAWGRAVIRVEEIQEECPGGSNLNGGGNCG